MLCDDTLLYYYLSSCQYDFLISFCKVMREIFMWMTILFFLYMFFKYIF